LKGLPVLVVGKHGGIKQLLSANVRDMDFCCRSQYCGFHGGFVVVWFRGGCVVVSWEFVPPPWSSRGV
jgi:hypothetical protein